MKIKVGYSMGYAGTDSEWTEEIPEEIVEAGQEAINNYLEELQNNLFYEASDKISVWAEIEE